MGIPYPPSRFKSLKGEYNMGTKDSIMWGKWMRIRQLKNTWSCRQQSEPCWSYFASLQISWLLFWWNYFYTWCWIQPVWCFRSEMSVKYRDHTIEEMLQAELKGKEANKGFCLTRSGSLNENHDYWHQVLGEFIPANTSWAHFAIWITKELKVIVVQKNSD